MGPAHIFQGVSQTPTPSSPRSKIPLKLKFTRARSQLMDLSSTDTSGWEGHHDPGTLCLRGRRDEGSRGPRGRV